MVVTQIPSQPCDIRYIFFKNKNLAARPGYGPWNLQASQESCSPPNKSFHKKFFFKKKHIFEDGALKG